jgi:hypothetical protein
MAKRQERSPNRITEFGIGRIGGGPIGEPISHVRIVPNAEDREQERQSKLQSKYYHELNPYEYGPLDANPEGPDGRND